MTKEGAALVVDPASLVSNLFALIPVPVAIADESGRIALSNSAFSDLFEDIRHIHSISMHDIEVPGRGIYEMETVPLNDQGMKIVYAKEITSEVRLRSQVVHLEKMAAIGRLVSGVAHELNNPLAGILGYAQLAAKANVDPETKRMMDVILAQAERAGKIVQNFLGLAAKTDPKRVRFDLNATVRNVLQLREYQESVEDIAVTAELPDNLPAAWGDPYQVEQVILNLIVNAEDAIADAGRQPGSISVKTSVNAGCFKVTVTDNGSGIHARDMARIFDPFFTTKDRLRGTGLGLSICAEIAKDHGGDLYAWSAYGSGSTFTLELPCRNHVEAERAQPVSDSCEEALRGKRILVVDDEIHMTDLIYDVLTRQGASIDLANSGADAIEQIKKRRYDVIICDQRMPGLSGQRLYRLAEELSPELGRHFLFVTGDVVNAHTRRFFAQTGIRFIRKPFRIQELVDAIRNLLDGIQL